MNAEPCFPIFPIEIKENRYKRARFTDSPTFVRFRCGARLFSARSDWSFHSIGLELYPSITEQVIYYSITKEVKFRTALSGQDIDPWVYR